MCYFQILKRLLKSEIRLLQQRIRKKAKGILIREKENVCVALRVEKSAKDRLKKERIKKDVRYQE